MNTYSILDYYDGENSELFKSSVMVVMEELVVSYRTAFHWEPFQVLGNLKSFQNNNKRTVLLEAVM